MPIIKEITKEIEADRPIVWVKVDRHTLEKRRWRILADDGQDLAVDLVEPCSHGDVLGVIEGKAYVVEQTAEAIMVISLSDQPMEAARLGWFLGNQHLPVEIKEGTIRMVANEHLRGLLDRQGIGYTLEEGVIAPDAHSKGGHHHHSH